ncbi:MAG: peptidoglycan-binding domain-containing protein [Geminicoccaceae bacterium]
MKHRSISRRYLIQLSAFFAVIPLIGVSITEAVASGARRPKYRKGLVRAVQSRLAEAGYDVGPIDGILGSRTKAGIMQFKRDNALDPFANGQGETGSSGQEAPSDLPITDVDWAINEELEAALGLR